MTFCRKYRRPTCHGPSSSRLSRSRVDKIHRRGVRVISGRIEWRVMKAGLPILAVCAFAASPAGPSYCDFHLPAKAVFSPAMPRYPNVWFYLDASLVTDHQAAIKLVTGELRQAFHFRELRLPNSEGCDFEVRLEHFQPWEDSAHKELQHAH